MGASQQRQDTLNMEAKEPMVFRAITKQHPVKTKKT
jgi:hypothetical protein